MSRSTDLLKSIAEISLEIAWRCRTGRARIRRVDRQSPRSFGSALGAVDVGPAARGFGDRAIGAHERGEIILELAFARVAPADAHALAGRRRIDVEPGARRELGQRIDVGHVDPVRAAIERHAEAAAFR